MIYTDNKDKNTKCNYGTIFVITIISAN